MVDNAAAQAVVDARSERALVCKQAGLHFTPWTATEITIEHVTIWSTIGFIPHEELAPMQATKGDKTQTLPARRDASPCPGDGSWSSPDC